MEREVKNSEQGNRNVVLRSVGWFFLPLVIPVGNVYLGVLTFPQSFYSELGIVAAIWCYFIAASKTDRVKLWSGAAFLMLSVVPLMVTFLLDGEWRSMMKTGQMVVFASGIFVIMFLLVHQKLAKRGDSSARYFTWGMCLLALIMHALLFPMLLGEPLRAHILHIADPGEEIIVTNPSGGLVLTHSALMPVRATLYDHDNGQLTLIRQEALTGYPVGIRVRDDDALIALRIQNEDRVVERIDFVRFTPSGLELMGSYPCTPEENPSHLVNNLSSDGKLLALADGAFVDVAKRTRVALLPPDANSDGGLKFHEWTEPEGLAVFEHNKDGHLVILNPRDCTINTLMEGEQSETVALENKLDDHRIRVSRVGERDFWYDTLSPASGIYARAIFSGQPLEVSNDAGPPNLAGYRITLISKSSVLTSMTFDEKGRIRSERYSQLLDMATDMALARESNWLFWITQAPQGEGTAIHGEMLP